MNNAVETTQPLVAVRKLSKRFPGILANDQISLDLWPGEVHVLLGENGAGKSTLVGMLSGLQQPDEGEIVINGHRQVITSPRRALQLGIGTVFQHSMMVPTLTVAENLALGEPWWQRPNRQHCAQEIVRISREIGVKVNPSSPAGALSLGEQQQAEIVRSLLRGSRLLILDEATAMLTPRNAQELGELMRRLVAQNLAVVFITHKLNEALAYGDRISVLRSGRKVGEIPPARLKQLDNAGAMREVVSLMFNLAPQPPSDVAAVLPVPHPGLPVWKPKDFSGVKPLLEIMALGITDGEMSVSHVELKIRPGEILGIAGIDGNGQKQLAEGVAGQRPLREGRIFLQGTSIEDLSIGQRRRLGLRYVTDDRLTEGTVGGFSVALNLVLKQIGEAPFWQRGIEQPGRIAEHARRLINAFDVRTPTIDTACGTLSGGNIQKVLLARELSGFTKAVLFAKPTYGLDLQNIAATRRRIREAAEQGLAVMLISTDLEEIIELADNIAVMSQGRIVGQVTNGSEARQQVGKLMSGMTL
ncbi:ABC transporter ATP-binding protein [Acerihabitans sp. TG2]|uniref:putative B6 ABC transporter ATP-binding protein n=1 Tax=Acerihabitans sp. TG2 TaxID=3096008 RepID=UPI002B228504|nr:ABC transporter ATP-binding protein [Acerihabitans sp. TG2]MEA9391265.1 ABC transporter ATP-binding protein [Acerihabitans sp. TG2]